jgi:internalin A
MPKDFDGQRIARQRIHDEAERRTGFLDLHQLGLTELPPLAHLPALQSLDCSGTQVSELGPLAHLPALRSLNCSTTQVTDLGPLAHLPALQSLNCSFTRVTDLGPLAHLPALQSLDCSFTRVTNLGPLAHLPALRSLRCDFTQVTDLGPLAPRLQSLSFRFTQVTDLGPLAHMPALQSLNCSCTEVSELGPLVHLPALQSLDCSHTQVTDLGPLVHLPALQSLDCSHTQVTDLGPLAHLPALQSLNCSNCNLSGVPEAFWHKPSLTNLVLYRSRLPGVPAEVLSQDGGDNCLESLRAHLRDVAAEVEAVNDVTLLVLGNGRSGKTQLTRRLANQPFQPYWDSTHGIRVASSTLPVPVDGAVVRLNIWDFGGQDLYHGIHALFVRTHAVFVLVWATDTNVTDDEHQDISFRNHPLLYWVEYVRHLAQAECPVVIVQTKCDRDADEEPRAPVPDEALKALGFRREVHFGASNDRGRDELEAALRGAVASLWHKQGTAKSGAGRLRVQRRLESLRNADRTLPAEYRLINQETFRAWCREEGGVSSPDHLLAYLHNAGIVLYQKGLFGDRIVLDHAWALNAIYAVFDRTRCYRRLQKEGGRFDRLRLEELIWKERGYSTAEQRLFLSMMRSCGICFVYHPAPGGIEDETIYIAPDLLPGRDAVQTELDDRWGPEEPAWSMTFDYVLLHSGLIRRVIARIGDQAHLDAIYWRGGVYVYETTTRSRALIEEEMNGWRGTVRLATKGGRGRELMDRLAARIGEENDRLGLRPQVKSSTPAALPDPGPSEPPLAFGPEPATRPQYCVSYAWNDDSAPDREAIVNQLCADAESRGIHILRDKTDMCIGDRISAFMHRLAEGQLVFVILSEKYLRSIYCMTELYEIWLNCKGKDDRFLACVRVFTQPDAKISDLFQRAERAAWWKEKHERVKALVDVHGQDFLSDSDYADFRRMGHFVRHVPDILSLVQDTLRPRSFDELVHCGFDGQPRPKPSG